MFDYNPAFDALRFTVKPSPTSHDEHLRYTIEPAGTGAALVSLAWETCAVTFRVELKQPGV